MATPRCSGREIEVTSIWKNTVITPEARPTLNRKNVITQALLVAATRPTEVAITSAEMTGTRRLAEDCTTRASTMPAVIEPRPRIATSQPATLGENPWATNSSG